MDEATFWALIEETRSADPAEHADRHADRVAETEFDGAEAFDRLWQERRVKAYRWDLWAAAYEINGGCSDDCFRDFRNYLISLGRRCLRASAARPGLACRR